MVSATQQHEVQQPPVEQQKVGLPAQVPQAGTLERVGSTPADMLAALVARNAPMDQLEKFMALKERHEANEARKSYVSDMAAFKANPPEILKDKAVGYTTKDGEFVGYKHATLGNVTSAICTGLAANGFSHRWDVRQDDQIVVTCTITHRLGHAESVTMQAPRDDSGKKNAIQQIASTVTYLQRYTLLAATGLAVEDGADDDGRGTHTDEDSGKDNRIAAKPAYYEADFEKNLPAWTKLILEGNKNPADIIKKIESKSSLTEAQKKKLNDIGVPGGVK